MPLFELEGLQEYLRSSPQFLLWSFLGLTLSMSSHEYYKGQELEAIGLYTRSAEDILMKLAADGIQRIEVIQASCLLALIHVEGKHRAPSFMILTAQSPTQRSTETR